MGTYTDFPGCFLCSSGLLSAGRWAGCGRSSVSWAGAHCQFALDTVHLFCDGDGPVLHVQVCPEEGGDFTPPQARGQFQIERCQQAAFIRFHQIEFNFTFRQDFHSRF